jgi:hypothetical protein
MKVPLTISVEHEDVELLRQFCEKTGLPISKLYQDYTRAMAQTLRAVGVDRKERLSKMDLLRIFATGARMSG